MAGLPEQPQHPEGIAEHIARLEARLARVEAQLGLSPVAAPDDPLHREAAHEAGVVGSSGARAAGDEWEQRLGQSAFTLAGVVALTSGLGVLLSLPHSNLPPAAPGLAGIAVSSALLVVARLLRKRVPVLGEFVRGAAMLLFYFATLRFFFFGQRPALDPESVSGRALLVFATVANAVLAWRARSPWLVVMVLLMGAATGLTLGPGVAFVVWLPFPAAAAVVAGWRWKWPALALAAIPLTHLTYFLWAIGNPILRGGVRFGAEQPAAPGLLAALVALFAAGSLGRPERDREDGLDAIAALLNCGLGYGAMLIHTAAAYAGSFVALHAATFAAFLGLAVLFQVRARAPVSTFVYAITGYIALSMAILKATSSPHVFVWLSAQSLVVLATAIWFRSRLIVVANFLIYAAIVLGYVFFVKRETGVSIGFGLVALISARLLNWRQERLELKTGLMRNAYLLSGFTIFPYALHHLVPARWIALAWVGLAVGYYALNRLVRNQKYRWMGHATLALTALFLVFGTIEPVWRIASFLALGTVLLAVSLLLRDSRA